MCPSLNQLAARPLRSPLGLAAYAARQTIQELPEDMSPCPAREMLI